MSAGDPRRRRVRRRPEDAEAEIAKAAESLLRRCPLHALTITAIMRETTLSRNSFYVYFENRYALLARVMDPILERLDQANALFLDGSGDPIENGRAALQAVAQICRKDGAILRAVREASAYDADARNLWEGISNATVEAFAQLIREEIDAGRMLPVDPEPTIRALIGMDLSVLLSEAEDNPTGDWDRLVDALLVIWARTLLPAAAES